MILDEFSEISEVAEYGDVGSIIRSLLLLHPPTMLLGPSIGDEYCVTGWCGGMLR